MNPVFENINEETYKKVKSVICSNFESCQNENIPFNYNKIYFLIFVKIY